MLTRSQINSLVHIIASRLGLDKGTLCAIIANVDPASEGHISRCTDFNAAAVLGTLRLESDARGAADRTTVARQQAMIARLMQILEWRWRDTALFCEKITGKDNTRKLTTAERSSVIRGMIGTIDHHLASGKIVMSHDERFEYNRHTKGLRDAG